MICGRRGGEVGRRDLPHPPPHLLLGRERETPMKATELFHLSVSKKVKNGKQPKRATTRDWLNRFIYIM